MKLPISLLVLFLCSSISASSDEKEKDVSEVISKNPDEADGVLYLGLDGVLREFDGSGNVSAYYALGPKQIKQYNSYFPTDDQEKLNKAFDGVDGRNVTDKDQLLHPGHGFWPVDDGDAKSAIPSNGPRDDPNNDKKLVCNREQCKKHGDCKKPDCKFCGKSGPVRKGYCLSV
ncbi:hypothetical protein BDV28DRAFT_144901 [Aspergillus coremiiformis]|uniref:Uncharacterized protein n=1 Tax=Aspergillus coremiiformis TaxID=138285 RepID=A0A5N6ZHD9_9EURO|nr:hypothetical protein BDV28DRAFT_144901 [Aspergillus coremiiformis]